MDLLKLGNEMIRNEALLLLIEISKTNIELQKVIAFENGFENLLEIIESEGFANGGIVVQDSLTLINNLLSGNTSNQNHFREMNCIKRLAELLKVDTTDFWTISDDKRDILLLTLNAVCALLGSPSSVPISPQILSLACAPATPSSSHSSSMARVPGTGPTPTSMSPVPSTSNWVSLLCPVPSIQSTQSQLGTHRILARTIEIGISQLRAPTVRIKALWALGDQIFCHNENRVYLEQNDFATRAGNGNGRTSAMLKVTQIVFFSKVPMESLAALHVLKCYFHNNPASQRVFAATIVKPTSDAAPTPQSLAQLAEEAYPARVIVGHIAALGDPMKSFFASSCLSYILTGNTGVKEQLLNVNFNAQATPGAPIENLLAKLVQWLVQSIDSNSELPVIVGLFRAIATWLEDCSMAANYFRAVNVVSASTGPTPVSIMQYLAALIPQNAASATNPNLNFAAGLAAFVFALALDPTIASTPDSLEHSPMFQARLNSITQSPDFARIARGGPRGLDDESKLPFFDAPFALSLLRLSNLLFPPIPGGYQPTHGQTHPHPGAPSPTPNVVAPNIIHKPATVTPAASLFEQPSNGANQPMATATTSPNGHANPQPIRPNGSATPITNGTQATNHQQAHQNQPHHGHTSHSDHSHSNGNQAELESLRSALQALQKEQSEWNHERSMLQSQLQQAQNYSSQLQAQLGSATASNQSLISQLTQMQDAPTPQKNNADGEFKTKYETLTKEFNALMAEHEDLLVLLAETQDENEALQSAAAAATSTSSSSSSIVYPISTTQAPLFEQDSELL